MIEIKEEDQKENKGKTIFIIQRTISMGGIHSITEDENYAKEFCNFRNNTFISKNNYNDTWYYTPIRYCDDMAWESLKVAKAIADVGFKFVFKYSNHNDYCIGDIINTEYGVIGYPFIPMEYVKGTTMTKFNIYIKSQDGVYPKALERLDEVLNNNDINGILNNKCTLYYEKM